MSMDLARMDAHVKAARRELDRAMTEAQGRGSAGLWNNLNRARRAVFRAELAVENAAADAGVTIPLAGAAPSEEQELALALDAVRGREW